MDLSQVVAPPYDVIGPEDRHRLAARHSVNVVNIDVPEPDHRANLDRYANAARQLERWEQEGILVRDPEAGVLRLPDDHPGGPDHQRGDRCAGYR